MKDRIKHWMIENPGKTLVIFYGVGLGSTYCVAVRRTKRHMRIRGADEYITKAGTEVLILTRYDGSHQYMTKHKS